MYTIILLRSSYGESDCATDGIMSFDYAHSTSDAIDTIKEIVRTEHYRVRSEPSNAFADIAITALYNGKVFSTYPQYSEDIYIVAEAPEFSTEEEKYIFNVGDIMFSESKKITKNHAFCERIKNEENVLGIKLKTLYSNSLLEEQERKRLTELMEKYPDMVKNYGT
ncbi:hypothetical protein VWH97_07065 [Escherichia coli O157]|nr:hypothetical protein [Escherichia coli O157]